MQMAEHSLAHGTNPSWDIYVAVANGEVQGGAAPAHTSTSGSRSGLVGRTTSESAGYDCSRFVEPRRRADPLGLGLPAPSAAARSHALSHILNVGGTAPFATDLSGPCSRSAPTPSGAGQPLVKGCKIEAYAVPETKSAPRVDHPFR